MNAIATCDSSNAIAISSSGIASGSSLLAYFEYAIKITHKSNDVVVRVINNSYESEFTGKQLTVLGLKASESSLANIWDGEDDEYWDSFL
jgi:hypothetical protein